MDIAQSIIIRPATSTPEQEEVRRVFRSFLQEALASLPPRKVNCWNGYNPEFSRKLGEAGWLGITWPKEYGGRERPQLERFVVLEELLAAGAPVSAHWIAERQCGPLLMRYGNEALRKQIVPRIAKGELYFCIGLSEPDCGSDLASIRTRAEKVPDGWVINGAKVWTSNAARAHFMSALVRTTPGVESRHAGLSQFVVDMKTEGLTVRPIRNMVGQSDFAEVVFDNVFVPDSHLIGNEGDGWRQVTTELTFERSGPDRYLSSTQLMAELLDHADAGEKHHAIELGRAVAELSNLRAMSRGIANMINNGDDPRLATSIVKDAGALHEQRIPELAHLLFGAELRPDGDRFIRTQSFMTQHAICFSIRGGTREILRGITAKGLGLR
ncbi:acyl-CoA dehydrogenase family protein [Cupriavidus alkaliphilus]|uniref:acyl-CoA dehydrogenase family protein n=1 Tax=Cupriavidus alkaliphilus TaxID=942866 RepID=UPI00160D5DDB|nr:acyl-CoA dehydrogenase family protein [Cupriavidus alkaliphilus]MBB2919343.1 acyl-CoA dehydrogenase [Cupriavidus alkaliphilus]